MSTNLTRMTPKLNQARIGMKIHNRFDVFVKNRETGEEKQVAFAENIILNSLWAKLLSSSSAYFAYIQVGTGTGALDPTRTTLFSYLSYKARSNPSKSFDLVNGIASARCSIQFIESELVGQTLREVGIAHGTASSTLVTHALLRDMNGNPVSILKTNLDIITIYATVYLVWDVVDLLSRGLSVWLDDRVVLTDEAGTLNALLGLYSTVNRAGYFCKDSGRVFGEPTPYGTHSASFSPTWAYDVANKKITSSVYRLPAAEGNGNAVGYRHITFGACFDIDLLYATGFYGSIILGETLGNGDGLVSNFSTDYPHVREGAVVKIDGVAEAGVTIGYGDFINNDITSYMRYMRGYGGGLGGTDGSAYTNCTIYFENPLYATHGLISLKGYGPPFTLSASNDFITWETVFPSNGKAGVKTVSIPLAFKNYRYWRANTGPDAFVYDIMTDGMPDHNITFTTPPGLVTAEAVGTGDDTEVEFILTHEPIAGSLTVKLDGTPTVDYTITEGTITFNSAPGAGVVITADYRYACLITIDYETPVIAKDVNHVFDCQVVIYFSEYTPA